MRYRHWKTSHRWSLRQSSAIDGISISHTGSTGRSGHRNAMSKSSKALFLFYQDQHRRSSIQQDWSGCSRDLGHGLRQRNSCTSSCTYLRLMAQLFSDKMGRNRSLSHVLLEVNVKNLLTGLASMRMFRIPRVERRITSAIAACRLKF
jgi:hypothetical protein